MSNNKTKLTYGVLPYSVVPPFIPFRYKGKWWSREDRNKIRTTFKEEKPTEYSTIENTTLVAIEYAFVPCQYRKNLASVIRLHA